MSTPRARSSLAALLLAGAALCSGDATACAILPVDGSSGPRLSVERVALLYDDAAQMEHLVREVRFDEADGAFAFVVPTPGKPNVAAVTTPPFDDLSRAFPLEPPPEEPSRFSLGGGAEAKSAPAGVTVLSQSRIGKFTAFVLAADDTSALDQWLRDNRITLPAGGKEWLDHYVALRFYFAAFRYEAPARARRGPVPVESAPEQPGQFASPPPGVTPAPPPQDNAPPYPDSDAPALTSETVRLSFPARVPFFPYLEPSHSARPGAETHTMEIWLVSRAEREPRLRRMAKGRPARWAWPWQTRLAHKADSSALDGPLHELGALLPRDGTYHVQTFRDERINRDGWGDILFPVATTPADEPRWLKTAVSFVGDLDSGIHAGDPEPREDDNESSFRIAPSARGCACNLGERSDDSGAWLALSALGLALSVRRARRPLATSRRRRH
jgi:MYXO-CTERM domain-containing protein